MTAYDPPVAAAFEQIDSVWVIRETLADGTSRVEPLTCEIRIVEREAGANRGAHTCGKPAAYRAITGASDGSGQSYDERLCCATCKAADEESGKYYVDGVLVEDYGPMYEYEELTAGNIDV